MEEVDVLATDDFTVTRLPEKLHVGRISLDHLQGCSWPLLKAMFGSGNEDDASAGGGLGHGFFSLTQDEDEVTLIMDERCRACFDEARPVARVEYAPNLWRAFELHLGGGSLAWEVPGLVCFIATLMAEAHISILNLSSHDRDFLLVQESDMASAERVIQQRLPRASVGLKEAITEKAITDGEISLIIDEASLTTFPEGALVGSESRWQPLRLCGKSFAFDETGVVSSMYAPYEEGMPLLNFSTFSTNVSLVEVADLDRALESFDVPVLRHHDTEAEAAVDVSS